MVSHKKALTLSLVIPAYNEEKNLKYCLDAIAKQKITPNEVIVVDNNSDDSTSEVAKSYSFVTLLHENEKGIVYARNKGFNRVSSDIIGRIDADTILPANWTEHVIKFFETNGLSEAWTGNSKYYNLPTPIFDFLQKPLIFSLNKIITGHYMLWGSNMAISKEVWDDIKEKTCLRTDIHEDLDLSLHLYRGGVDLVFDQKMSVGTALRLRATPRLKLWANLKRWPKTLQIHHVKGWFIAWAVVAPAYILSPIPNFMEKVKAARKAD